MSQFVMWYDSREGGSPVLNNVAGSLIGVLDACLVTGFNNKTISSLVVASGVATATCAAHGFMGKYSQDIEISGASVPALNGRFQPTVVDANTFTFLAPSVSNQTVSGTITAKRPSLGWSKPFFNADTAIYQRTDTQASSMLLRVSEPAGATSVRVLMLESATSISAFTDQSPTQAQVVGGQYWYKNNTSTSGKPWQLVGDGKRFYFFVDPENPAAYPRSPITQERPFGYCFGDFSSLKPADSYNCMVLGMDTDIQAQGFSSGNDIAISGSGVNGANTPAFCLARAADQSTKSVFGVIINPGGRYSGGDGSIPYPSSVDGGLVLQSSIPILEHIGNTRQVRGFMPGVLHVFPLQPLPHTTIISPVLNLQNRSVILLACRVQSNTITQTAIDITGPWA